MNERPVILITGASRGLGRGIAEEVARAGFDAAIHYASNSAAAEETQQSCRACQADPGQKFIPIQADLGKKGEREKLVAETLRHLGRLDALVNNAGIAPKVRCDLTELAEESFDDLIDVNLKAPLFLSQQAANHWLRNPGRGLLKGGYKLIFISSISAYTASVNRGEYCISKAGLAMVNQLWATRLASHGVQTVEFRPGIMATDMTSGVKEKYDKLIAEGLVPQGRWGAPADVGLAVRAFLEGCFPFTTGDVINLDGGFHLRRL
jgi:3-oxoacyl-[acyl-carrier protein] reductase